MVKLAHTPDVSEATAPWQLTGQAYVTIVRMPDEYLEQHGFIPESLKSKRLSNFGLMMFVDYSSSDAGPYYELLFIPGHFAFGDKKCLSISRIFVSSWDSVVNGQLNWGIPKDQADFAVEYNAQGGVDRVKVSQGGSVFAQLDYRHYPLPVPITSAVIPPAMRTLGQLMDGKTYLYCPSSRGWARPARLVKSSFDDSQFPDINQGRVLATVKLSSFQMTFPVASILECSI